MERFTAAGTVEIDSDLVLDLTRALIRFPSVNPPGNEGPVAEYLAGRLEELGLEAEIQEIEPGRANVIGRLPGSGEDGHLAMTGHLDVVPPGEQQWEHDPFGAEVVDGRLYGRGSADMKGGVAAIVAAMAALAKQSFRPRGDLLLAATCGEEAGMLGAQAVVDRGSLQGSRWLVVAEPSDLNVYIGEKGVLWVDVHAYGRTAHGSMPHLGTNAVSFLARLVPHLEAYPFPWHESALLGGPTLSVNIFEGGNKTNVVPDHARMALDMRTVPGQDHADILRRIHDIANQIRADFNEDLRVELVIDNDKAPLETERSDPLVDALVASVTAVRGQSPEVGGVTYATDASALSPGFGIPMVICGPGAAGMAHQPDENVPVADLTAAAAIYADLAVRLLG